MDVTLTEEQQLLAEMARAVGERLGGGPEVPLPDDGGAKAWQVLLDAGLVGLGLPEATGGGGAGTVELAVVAEAFGATLCRAPWLGQGVLGPATLDAARQSAVVAGDLRVTLTLAADLQAPGPDLAVDALGADGVGEPVEQPDLTRVIAAATHPTTGDVTALALTLLSAEMVGLMDGALAGVVDHARERVQFDVPIGSFQAVQHLCAEAKVSIEAARSATYHAAWALDALDADDALLAARVAKAYTSSVVRDVLEAVVQAWGGIGMTWECPAHLYLKRALLDRVLFGDEHVQLARIADARLGTGVA